MIKCYFGVCENIDCQVEVVTGISIGGIKHWNPICPSCLAKTFWAIKETRPIMPRPVDPGTRTSNSGCEGSIPSRGSNQEQRVTVGEFTVGNMTMATLWGTAGGQLEFVSMKTSTEMVDGVWRKYIKMKFTDHDLRAVDEEDLKSAGLSPYYEFVFPIE